MKIPDIYEALLHSAAVATGNGTALLVNQAAHVGVQVEGISGDTITFEGSLDNDTWYALKARNLTSGAEGTTATADGLYVVPVTGLNWFRARISTYSAGTITVRALQTTLDLSAIGASMAIGSIAAGNNNIGDVDVASIAAGTNLIGKVQPFAALIEGGLTEIVDKDDAATAASTYTKSVSVALAAACSGEIKSFLLVASELDNGAVLANACTVLIFDADPAIAAADAALAAAGAEHKTLIGQIPIATTDWIADANGASAFKSVAIPFHSLSTLYFALLLTAGATTLNSAANDDEEYHFNFWYRRES